MRILIMPGLGFRSLRVLLASPRGFCAGVERAILVVQATLERYGSPVYVRHEIVHNPFVVESLREQGAVFVEDLESVPSHRPVVFSAHGVAQAVIGEARLLDLHYFDATCPLVSKVHMQAQKYVQRGYHVLLIGHSGHPEVIGTMGQVPIGSMTLVQDLAAVAALPFGERDKLAYVTQTTLSLDDTAVIIEALKARFVGIVEPPSQDICYATSNRQNAVKEIAGQSQLVLIVGAENSSNSMRLVDVARRSCRAHLIRSSSDIDWSWFEGVDSLGLSAGASAPEVLVQDVILSCRSRFTVDLQEIVDTVEDLNFKLPRALRGQSSGSRLSAMGLHS